MPVPEPRAQPQLRDPVSHAVLDLDSRRLKGAKIERLLGLDRTTLPLRVLEVGSGSGGIAQYLATRPVRHDVHAVDTIDNRIERDGYSFRLVEGTTLPFPSATFDVVVSNHVIEHVGAERAQRSHLEEVRRVMKPTGMAYLAFPNRWRMIEPHYRLLALSIWPRPWRTPYLRMFRRGDEYDCEPLDVWTIERMLADVGLRAVRMGVEALRTTLDLEHPRSAPTRMMRHLPDVILRQVEPMLPTLIYRLAKE
ncbi:MAG: class I SAM-dependent methyltransferase [Chloroflexi bacterium]|nr:class I SAM-dependent methyltransferase [Chloroflexota bacterium]